MKVFFNRLAKVELNTWLILALVFIPLCFGAKHLPTEMGIAGTCIALALGFANLDRFTEFKGLGFEGKMREAEKAVEETYAAIGELRALAITLTIPIVQSIVDSGLMVSSRLIDKIGAVKEIELALEELEVPAENIQFATRPLHEYLCFRHLQAIKKALAHLNPTKSGDIDKFKIYRTTDVSDVEVRRFISDNGLEIGSELEKLIEDLEFYLEHRKFRRPERWESIP